MYFQSPGIEVKESIPGCLFQWSAAYSTSSENLPFGVWLYRWLYLLQIESLSVPSLFVCETGLSFHCLPITSPSYLASLCMQKSTWASPDGFLERINYACTAPLRGDRRRMYYMPYGCSLECIMPPTYPGYQGQSATGLLHPATIYFEKEGVHQRHPFRLVLLV